MHIIIVTTQLQLVSLFPSLQPCFTPDWWGPAQHSPAIQTTGAQYLHCAGRFLEEL